jgi:acylpyruvate hydrolase
MKLLTFLRNRKFTSSAGLTGQVGALLSTNEILDLSLARPSPSLVCWVPNALRDILEAGEEGLEFIRRIVNEVQEAPESERENLRERGAVFPLEGTRLLAPVPQPSLIVSAGKNYGQHLREMGTPKPLHPTGFMKSTTAVIGPNAPIILPEQFPDMVDFEGEFSLIFGRACHNVDVQDAMNYVAGFTIVNDVSARNWVTPAIEAKDTEGAILAWQVNIMGKQLPTFCPMGPVMVTRDEIMDPHNLNLTTRLNGVVMQSANTGDLLFKLPELISYFSKWYQFQPGNLITTGSPGGVGFARNPRVFMKPGDIVTIHVDGVGTLSNPIAAAH